jgi:hypothetical protein
VVRRAKLHSLVCAEADTLPRTEDHKHAMTYRISSGKTFNTVLAHKDDSDPSLWTSNSARRDMEDHYDGWDPR